METDNVLVLVAVVAMAFSVAGAFFTFSSVSDFKNMFTGYATENGTVNITIEESVLVQIISAAGFADNKTLDWGTGSVTNGAYAVLSTSNGSVDGGSWGAIDQGFIIENKGNVNVTLDVHSELDAANFIGGSNPLFQYNITNNKPDSCLPGQLHANAGDFVNFTTEPVSICGIFGYLDSRDTLRLDILLGIPASADPGAKNNVVILTYNKYTP